MKKYRPIYADGKWKSIKSWGFMFKMEFSDNYWECGIKIKKLNIYAQFKDAR